MSWFVGGMVSETVSECGPAGGTGIGFIPLCWRWSQGLVRAGQMLCHSATSPAPRWLPIGRLRLKWPEMRKCGTPEYYGPFASAFADWHLSQARGTDGMALSSAEFLELVRLLRPALV